MPPDGLAAVAMAHDNPAGHTWLKCRVTAAMWCAGTAMAPPAYVSRRRGYAVLHSFGVTTGLSAADRVQWRCASRGCPCIDHNHSTEEGEWEALRSC